VVKAFVDEKRREANNLPPEKPGPAVEVGAVWSTPRTQAGAQAAEGGAAGSHIQAGHFFLNGDGTVTSNAKATKPSPKTAAEAAERPKPANGRAQATNAPAKPLQSAATPIGEQ